MPTKDEVAQRLIDWHFESEPGLISVFHVRTLNEDDPEEPIKLIEINTASISTGRFEPYRFAPTNEVPYPTAIAELTPAEFEQLRDAGAFPDTWNLAGARKHRRTAA